jgi:hypothetical protein
MSLSFFLFLVVIVFVIGLLRTWKIEKSAKQKEFLTGTVPEQFPDGFYKGSVDGYGGSWKGKVCERASLSGINLFDDAGLEKKKYPFQMYKARGLRDPELAVIRIDYDSSGNPFWVRMVLDEIVQTSPDHYFGKVHVRLFPGVPFTVGFFRMEKAEPQATMRPIPKSPPATNF